MSDEAKKALEQFLIALIDATKDGAAWAKQQVPLVLQEKLAFDFAWALASVVLILASMFVSFRIAMAVQRWDDDYDTPFPILAWVGLGFHVAFAIAISVDGINAMLKIHYAPRLYLLEWAMALVK